MNKISLVIFLMFGLAWGAFAQAKKTEEPITLQCGEFTLVLDGKAAWAIKQIKRKDFALLAEGENLFPAGPAAEVEKEGWIGSGHGGEKVSLRLLTVDRKRVPFKEGSTYTAKEKITFEKRSTLGPYKLSTTLEVTPEEIVLTHEYRQERSTKVNRLYAFQYPFTSEFNLFSAQGWGDPDDPNTKRYNGAFYGENGELLKDKIRWFGLFCTERHTGIVCWYGGEYTGEEEQTILVDKPDHREYHFRPAISREGRGERLAFTLRMDMVECKTGDFPEKAARIAGSHWTPKMPEMK